MTQFGFVNFGRLLLVEFPTQAASLAAAAPSTTAPTGRTLALAGQESTPAAPNVATTAAQLRARQADLLGSQGSFLPVTFTDKAELNGYYTVTDVSADLQNWEQEAVTLTWKTNLERIGTDLEVDLESRLTGGIRNSSFAASANGVRWHAPSIGHYAYFTASGNTPSVIVRQSAEGAMNIYTGLPLTGSVIPRWGCAVGNYLGGRVRFLDDQGIERAGILFANGSPSSWTILNALVQVTPLSSGGVFNVASWASGSSAYQSKNWDLQYNSSSLGVPLGISLLRNEPEILVARLIWSTTGPNRVTADLTLRRGSRFLELYLQSQVAGVLKVVRSSAEAGTSGGSGAYLSATANDAAGNRYVIGSALTNTQDLVNGGISVSASTTFDAFVGAAVGGSSAQGGDAASDLWNQYIAAPAELVQGIRR
jgi:hypothetical protein